MLEWQTISKKALEQFEGDFKDEVMLVWKPVKYSPDEEFENLIVPSLRRIALVLQGERFTLPINPLQIRTHCFWGFLVCLHLCSHHSRMRA